MSLLKRFFSTNAKGEQQGNVSPSNDALNSLGRMQFNPLSKPSWPCEPERPIAMAIALAERCNVGAELLDIARQQQEDSDPGVVAYSAENHAHVPSASQQSTVTLPCVPTGVPSQGFSILNDWAVRTADAAAQGVSDASWLPAYLADLVRKDPTSLVAAACAADFLGCQPFQRLYLEIQLLRLVAGEGIRRRLDTAGSARQLQILDLSRLSERDLRQLPCLSVRGGERVERSPENPPGGSGDLRCGENTEPPSPSLRSAWGSFFQQLQPQPRQGSQQGQQQGLGAGSAGGADVSLEEMEAVVEGLMDSELLAYTAAQPIDVGTCLFQLGCRPVLRAACRQNCRVSDSKSDYIQLALTMPAVDGRPAVLGYEVDEVAVVAEAHDQGWSSYPQDRNTTRNSWTWGELVLLLPDGQPACPGDPGRLYTNLHAVSDWQTHEVRLGRDSTLVQDVNKLLAEGTAAAATAAAAPGAVGAQVCQLVLRVCAAFPGWEHSIRRGEIKVTLRPVAARRVDVR